MSVTLDELMEMVPPETERIVDGIRRRLNNSVRGILRREMALHLSRGDDSDPASVKTGTAVPVKVLPGYPAEYKSLELDPRLRLPILLAPLRGYLETFVSSGNFIQSHLPKEVSKQLLIQVGTHFPPSIDVAQQLLAIAESYDPMPDFFGGTIGSKTDETYILDFLGVYRYRVRSDVYATSEDNEAVEASIELYWGAIGLTAGILGTSVEGLTLKVLAHELAHAYSHVGFDIDGRRWRTSWFQTSDRAIKEGIAQYYAHRTVLEMQPRAPEALRAYEALVPRQPEPYQVHMRWEQGFDQHGGFKPEEVRLAMIAIRREGNTKLKSFEDQLLKARESLRAIPS